MRDFIGVHFVTVYHFGKGIVNACVINFGSSWFLVNRRESPIPSPASVTQALDH
jgi:hypothetical protein